MAYVWLLSGPMRQVYKFRDGKWVKAEEAEPLPQVYVIPDSMDHTWHPSDGKYYSSKSGFRQVTKASGCVEYGTEQIKDRRNFTYGDIKGDLLRAWEQNEKR